VQEALGELVGSAKEGLLALSVGVGLGVLAELLEEEVVGVVGAKGKHDPERGAVHHGHEAGAAAAEPCPVIAEEAEAVAEGGLAQQRLRPRGAHPPVDEHDGLPRPLQLVLQLETIDGCSFHHVHDSLPRPNGMDYIGTGVN
jgi:hypothetical protein